MVQKLVGVRAAHAVQDLGFYVTNQPVLCIEEKEHCSVHTKCMRNGRWPGELQLALDLLS